MLIFIYRLLESLDACALVSATTGKYILIPENSVRIYPSGICDCFLLGGKYDVNAAERFYLNLSIRTLTNKKLYDRIQNQYWNLESVLRFFIDRDRLYMRDYFGKIQVCEQITNY